MPDEINYLFISIIFTLLEATSQRIPDQSRQSLASGDLEIDLKSHISIEGGLNRLETAS